MRVKNIGLLFFPLVFLFNVTAIGNNGDLPREIFKKWIHSYEESTKDVIVYRPSDYNFPPSRGRGGFEIKESGEYISYGIGPDDRLQKLSGHWKAEGENKIAVYFKFVIVTKYQVEKAGLDWSDISDKLFKFLGGREVSPTEMRLYKDLEINNQTAEVFGSDFSKILPLLQQSQDEHCIATNSILLCTNDILKIQAY